KQAIIPRYGKSLLSFLRVVVESYEFLSPIRWHAFCHNTAMEEWMALEAKDILEALKQVCDPEIPVDIVNLGLVYEIRVEGEKVYVKMTTTGQDCPFRDLLAARVERAVRKIEGVREVRVEFIYDPPWTLARVSQAGRGMVGWWY
ncbi:MAG: metal-sulfur cluster assembly factor, partial [Nitrospiria bacterium]